MLTAQISQPIQLQRQNQAGFTLLEVTIATAITVIMMIAASGLFLATIRSNNKDAQVTSLKTDGDYAMGQMEFLLRNALSLVQNPTNSSAPICSSNMSSISFKMIDGGITTLSTDNTSAPVPPNPNPPNLIASKSATAAKPVYLTTAATTMTNLVFNCSQASVNNGTYVTISFTLSKDEANSNQPNTQTQNFQTSVVIRSF